jgi:hypothetical protein
MIEARPLDAGESKPLTTPNNRLSGGGDGRDRADHSRMWISTARATLGGRQELIE